jgi:hypothetical protein
MAKTRPFENERIREREAWASKPQVSHTACAVIGGFTSQKLHGFVGENAAVIAIDAKGLSARVP